MLNKDWSRGGSDVSLAGWHIAQVIDNNDPKACERVLVRVMGVHNIANDDPANAVWADHCSPTKYGSGDIPDVGDYLYVQFPDVLNPMRILWFGYVIGLVE